MFFYNIEFVVDKNISTSEPEVGEEVYFKPNSSEKKIDVYCKNKKIGNLINQENSLHFEFPDLFCERLFNREKWIFRFKIKGLYNIQEDSIKGEFDVNSLNGSAGEFKDELLALVETEVVPSGKKYIHQGGFRQVYGEHGEKVKQ